MSLIAKIKLCIEIMLLTGHEKKLSIFQSGYCAGIKDGQYEQRIAELEADKADMLKKLENVATNTKSIMAVINYIRAESLAVNPSSNLLADKDM
jgi:hypothetical protein